MHPKLFAGSVPLPGMRPTGGVERDMLNRGHGFLLGTACYLGICGGLCALAFLGEFVFPVSIDMGQRRPFLHGSSADFVFQPGDSLKVKE
ncbi:hypothetical protein [Edaphobacter modestus]|nr:hypothetical protein [Edaphobacter modestus]